MHMIEPVVETVENGISSIRIQNPPYNLLDDRVCLALLGTVLAAEKSDHVRAIVLDISGRSSSLNTVRMSAPSQDNLSDLCGAVEGLSKPVVAIISGRMYDSAIALACAAHYRIAEKNSELCCASVTWGALPAGGLTQRFPRLIGAGLSIDLLSSGKIVRAKTLRSTKFAERWARQSNVELARSFIESYDKDKLMPKRVCDRRDELVDGLQYQKTISAARAKNSIRTIRAVQKSIECVEAAQLLPFDVGLDFEREAFEECQKTGSFFGLSNAMNSIAEAEIPPNTIRSTDRKVKRIALVGAGTVGQFLAETALNQGFKVCLIDPSQERLDDVQHNIIASLDAALANNSVSVEGRGARISALDLQTAVPESVDYDLVLELGTVAKAARQKIFAQLDERSSPDVVMASTNPMMGGADLQHNPDRVGNFLTLNFPHPLAVGQMVELGAASSANAAAVSACYEFLKALKLNPIYVNSGIGLVGARLEAAIRYAACELVCLGASPEMIDITLRGFGFPLGPFETMDLVGLDVVTMQRQDTHHLLGKNVPPIMIVDQIADMGWVGSRSGRGFYIYEQGAVTLNPEVESIVMQYQQQLGITPRLIQPGEVRRRVWMALCNHGGHLLDAAIAPSTSVIDAIAIKGYGYPKVRGGPMATAERAGLAGVVRDLTLLGQENPFWYPSDAVLNANIAGQNFRREQI